MNNEGLATDNSLAQIELSAEAFQPTTQAISEIPIPPSQVEPSVIASASISELQISEAQIETPNPIATGATAEAIPATEAVQPHTTKVRDQLLAERERTEKRKRSSVKALSPMTAQMSFDWA